MGGEHIGAYARRGTFSDYLGPFVLIREKATLEASIPSSTGVSAAQLTPQGKETRQHARALRAKLEELETLRQDQDQLVSRAQSLAAADDIQARVMKAASGFERLADVTPDMFEDISDEELSKFDKFLAEMSDIERRQNEIIAEVQVRCSVFRFAFFLKF